MHTSKFINNKHCQSEDWQRLRTQSFDDVGREAKTVAARQKDKMGNTANNDKLLNSN